MSDSKALQDYERQLMEEAEAIKQTLSQPTANKISTRGKMFTLPDGTTNPGPMQCVILDWISFNSFYEGVYDQANPASPVCWAIDRVVENLKPSEACPKPQFEQCAGCPQDQYGSGQGKGKACKNTRRLIIAPVDATLETPLMTLEVSPSAIRVFDTYVRLIQRTMSTLPIRVITSIGFDPTKSYPSLTFSDPALHDNLAVMMELRNKGQDLLTAEPEVN